MLKFKTVLNKTELDDPQVVISYLVYSFGTRKKKKSPHLYSNINLIFDTYPVLVKEILDEIPALGYYKDYFYILAVAKNENLIAYIYSCIIDQLQSDIINLKLGEKISTLGKWLPREKSTINTGFIDKFNTYMFPHIKNKFIARREYRKLKTSLNKKLGTLESKLCARQYDLIEFDLVSPYALKKEMRTIMKHDVSRDNYNEYKHNQLKRKTLSEFTKELIQNRDIPQLEQIWDTNQYIKSIPMLADMINHAVCILDLSNDMYDIKGEYLTIGIGLLVDQYSQLANKIIIGGEYVKLSGGLITKPNQLIKHIGPMNLSAYYNWITEQKFENLIFVTTKKLDWNILNRNQTKILHIQPMLNTYVIPEQGSVTYYDKCQKSMPIHQKTKPYKKDIQTIINNNFRSKSSIWNLLLVLILIGIHIYG